MLNMALLGLLVLGCASLGFLAANRLKQREAAIIGLMSGFKTLAMYMEYADMPLRQAFEKAGGDTHTREFFSEIASCIDEKGLYEAFNQALGRLSCTGEDREILKSFAQNLGNTDKASQRKNFALLQNSLEIKRGEAHKAFRDKGKIYRSLGVLAGLAIAVVLA